MKRIFSLILILCLLLCGCAGGKPAEKTVYAMDTVMDIRLWGEAADAAAENIETLLHTLEKTYDATDPESALSRGALTAKEKALLVQAQALCRRTNGAFDPQLKGVMELWGFYDKNYTVPTPDALANAEKGWDLGGITKGYAGDLAVQRLKHMEISHGILSLGGNVQTYGEKPDGTPWQVGIQNPEGGDPVGILSVEGIVAVVTSGSYQRYFEEGGQVYHHIIDPATCQPARSGLTSVTVVSESGVTADALSTALFVMGLEKGAEFWRQSTDFEAVFVTTEGKIYATSGIALSGCEYEEIEK